MPIRERYSTLQEVIESRPDEFGAELVLDLQRRPGTSFFSPGNFPNELARPYGLESPTKEFTSAVFEGIAWAKRELLLVRRHGSMPPSDALMLSRSGEEFTRESFDRLKIERILPAFMLHERLRSVCIDIFNTGHYQAAVFEAFKVLEVAVREAAEFTDSDYGTDMVARAFNETSGPLTDLSALPAEKQAMQRLMSGAHGVFKNPRSHRDMELTDPREAAEMLILASHLLRIIETRSSRS